LAFYGSGVIYIGELLGMEVGVAGSNGVEEGVIVCRDSAGDEREMVLSQMSR
jgi:hypothetical protein